MFKCQPHAHRDQENTINTRNRLRVEETVMNSGEMGTHALGEGKTSLSSRQSLPFEDVGPGARDLDFFQPSRV